jgi:hypothetical protein
MMEGAMGVLTGWLLSINDGSRANAAVTMAQFPAQAALATADK